LQTPALSSWVTALGEIPGYQLNYRCLIGFLGRQVTIFSLDLSPESGQWMSESRKRPVVTECSRPKAPK
jgi:hypothetical protein